MVGDFKHAVPPPPPHADPSWFTYFRSQGIDEVMLRSADIATQHKLELLYKQRAWDAMNPTKQLSIPNGLGGPYVPDDAAQQGQVQRSSLGAGFSQSDNTFGPDNIRNKWFAKTHMDPMNMLAVRLRRDPGEKILPFNWSGSYSNDEYVWIMYECQNEMIVMKDDAHLFPSDELLAKIKLAIEAYSR